MIEVPLFIDGNQKLLWIHPEISKDLTDGHLRIPGSWQSLCRVLRGGRGDNEGLCEVLLRIELIVAIPPSHSTEKQ